MLWMDSDSYFTGQVPHEFAKEMNAAGAIFGYTHTGYEDSPLVKNLFDAALLFEAVELGGSKGRPPAALEEEERQFALQRPTSSEHVALGVGFQGGGF